MPSVSYSDVQHQGERDDAPLKQPAGDPRVGEWVREVPFKAVVTERAADAPRTILADVLALRKILG
jgi:hypothetical protein